MAAAAAEGEEERSGGLRVGSNGVEQPDRARVSDRQPSSAHTLSARPPLEPDRIGDDRDCRCRHTHKEREARRIGPLSLQLTARRSSSTQGNAGATHSGAHTQTRALAGTEDDEERASDAGKEKKKREKKSLIGPQR